MHVHCALRASFWRKAIFMSMAMLAGCPVIFHLHGGGFKHFYETECGALRRRIIRFFLDRSTYIIVLSERWRAWIDGISANRSIVCIPNPVAVPEGPSPRPRENLVLFLGRLERNKGVFDLLDAVSRAQKQIPDLRLVCAGDGDIESATRYAEKVSVRGAVSFPGWIGPAEKQSLMDRAAVCVLPSYAEGLPMSLLEAMACGLPVIATDVGGIPDLVADGVSGLLYTPGDIATLERLLCGLMRDPELGKRMALAARETVRLRFDAASAVAQLEEIYASVGLTPSGVRVRTPVDRLHEAA
jgi:glycosyltransferase involved in cell wall biosynthesis